MRLQKYLALCGVASRRKCEEIILAGRVAVDGRTVDQLGAQVEDGQRVTLDGAPVAPEARKRYILYYKPVGEVTTVSDDRGRTTVLDRFAGEVPERIYPVGRLDYDSEGLLLLTNDGALTHRLIHPSHEVEKQYLVLVSGDMEAALPVLNGPMELDGVALAPAQVDRLGPNLLSFRIHEGKNRQIRRMCQQVGLTVKALRRVREGQVQLGGLKLGKWRYLTEEEVALLKAL